MARRKRQAASGGGAEDDVNLTPMLDVVFILLIFFIVSATFVKTPGVEVNRPMARSADDLQKNSILFALANGYLDDVEIAKVRSFETALHNFMESNHPEVLSKLDQDKTIDEESEVALTESIKKFKASTPY